MQANQQLEHRGLSEERGGQVVVSWSTALDWQVPQGTVHEQHVMLPSGLARRVQVSLNRCTTNSQSRELRDGGSWHAASPARRKTCHDSQGSGAKVGSYQLRRSGAQHLYPCWCWSICYCCQFFMFVILNVSASQVDQAALAFAKLWNCSLPLGVRQPCRHILG